MDDTVSTAPANSGAYPLRFIMGMVMLPVVTTLATATPEIMPNRPLPITEALAGPPLRPPMADRDRFR